MFDNRKGISKADIILFTSVILLCGIVLICFYVVKKPGLTADIMISGETVKTVSLDETAAYIIYSSASDVSYDGEVKTNSEATAADAENDMENPEKYIVDGETVCIVKCSVAEAEKSFNVDSYNVMIVDDNRVNIIDADCPDKVCVNHSSIENVGETIICLPHKLVVEIKKI
jgi:hypothetical protein